LVVECVGGGMGRRVARFLALALDFQKQR
jgi:hypothetical protein